MPLRDLEQRMWAEACEMLERAERLRRQFFRPGGSTASPLWEPPVDVYRVPDGLWLVVALPGADPDTISVTVEHQALVVSARRGLPSLPGNVSVQRMEIPSGRFERRLALPPGDVHLTEQRWSDGCLYIALQVT